MVCSSALFYEYYKIMDVLIHMRLKDSLCMTLHIWWFPDSYVTLKDKYALVFDNIYIFFIYGNHFYETLSVRPIPLSPIKWCFYGNSSAYVERITAHPSLSVSTESHEFCLTKPGYLSVDSASFVAYLWCQIKWNSNHSFTMLCSMSFYNVYEFPGVK